MRLINNLRADVIGLQEVEPPLIAALLANGDWQHFWSPKDNQEPDGCLMLVRRDVKVTGFLANTYSDDSGHVMQLVIIDDVIFANTHIMWAPANDRRHPGVQQAKELVAILGATVPAVIFADGNDRPGGPVRAIIEAAGFANTCGHVPTALIGTERAALDLIAVRGLHAKHVETTFSPQGIPNTTCPSDHIPVMADIEVN